MDVLVTGAFGKVGTAIIDQLDHREEYEFTYLDRQRPDPDGPYGGFDTVVADVAEYEAIRPAFDGQDAVVHLAGHSAVDGSWEEIMHGNVLGLQNTLAAARDASVGTFVFASSNHAMGMYEEEHAPDLYYPGYDLMLDHRDPVRPDSYYGTSKVLGEAMGRQFVETSGFPEQFYALRLCSVRHEEYDHPYGDAERGVDQGRWERDSDDYREMVARMKAMWQSRRDFAHQLECCLQDDTVQFDVYAGVSANDRRWFDIDHARTTVGYDPQDNGEEWDAPPT